MDQTGIRIRRRGAAAAGVLLLLIICGLLLLGPGRKQENESPGGPEITVLAPGGELRRLPLEEFLTGVVAAEMPASFQPAALSAQAAAARTYILAALAGGGRHGEAAVCCDPGCCQAWRDPAELAPAAREKIESAVAATRGQALYYQGELAETPFCSCCGGRTESAAAVWGGERPWLAGVKCGYCGHAPRFCSCHSFPLAEAASRLGASPAELRQMKLLGLTAGGRVEAVELGERRLTGPEVRAALDLPSAAFTWLVLEDVLLVANLGFGHGVGLCQYGADGLARAGFSWPEILTRYYPGCELETAY